MAHRLHPLRDRRPDRARARRRRQAAAAVVVLASAWGWGPAWAGTLWDGGGANSNINTANNWDDNVNPAFDGTAAVTFGSGGTTAGITTPVSFLGVTFTRGFTLGNTSALTLGTGGVTVDAATGGGVTISAPVSLSAAQTWTNSSAQNLTVSGAITLAHELTAGGGTIILSGGNSGTGGVRLNAGTLRVGNTNFAGTGPITLAGGSLLNTDNTGRTISNSTVNIISDVTFGSSGTGALTFSGAGTSTTGDRTLTFNTVTTVFSTNPLTLGGQLAVTGSSGANFSGGFALGGSDRTVTVSTTGTTTIGGVLTSSVPGNKLVLAGGNMTVGAVLAGTNDPRLELNGTGIFSFNNAGGTYVGGTTLTAGTISLAVSSSGSAGPFGNPTAGNVLTLAGGVLRSSDGNARTIGNEVLISGNATLGATGFAGVLTFSNANVAISNANATTTFNTSTTTFSTAAVALNSDTTLQVNSGVTFSAGLGWSAGRVVTVNGSGATLVRGALAGGGGTLALAGTGSNVTIGDGTANVSGTAGAGLVVNGPTVSFSGAAAASGNTFTGGVTVQGGEARLGNSSVVSAGAMTHSPVGLGTLTLAGGTLRSTSNTTRTLHNDLVLAGNATIGVLSGGAAITVDPTTRTPAGSITVASASSLTLYNGLTLTGPVGSVGSPGLLVRSVLGTLTLTNASATASTFGALTVADGTVGTGNNVGGSVAASSLTALGGDPITINQGGLMNVGANTATAFTPTNAVTVNAGGTLQYQYNPGAVTTVTPTGTITVASQGAITATGGTNFTLGLVLGTDPGQTSLPAAGAVNLNASRPIVMTGAYPTLTGTLAIGGVGAGNTASTSAATTLSSVAGQARTLAFNASNGPTNLAGVDLNANLTVAGVGNSGQSGLVPTGTGGGLGTVTQVGGARSLTVAMAPTGVVSLNSGATHSGGTTLRSGVLSVTHPTGKAVGAPGVPINLDGGTFRAAGTGTATTMTDDFVVGPRGGVVESFLTTGTATTTLAGAFDPGVGGAGPVTLRYGGSGSGIGSLSILDGGTFEGGFVLATTNARGRVQFSATGTGGPGNVITVPSGVAFGFDSASSLNAALPKFSTTPGSILVVENLTGAVLDLSSGGLDRNLRIGNVTGVTFTGSIVPFDDTYRFTPAGGNTLTLGLADTLSGSTHLDVRAGDVSPGSTAAATGTLTISTDQSYSGSTTVSGVVHNGFAGTGLTGVTVQINANMNSAAGAVTVLRGSTFELRTAAGRMPLVSAVAVSGGSTFTAADTTTSNNNGVVDRLNPLANLTLGGSDGGGTFRVAYATTGNSTSQTLAGLSIAGGANTISTTGTAAGTLALTFTGAGGAGYQRSAGGVVTLPAPISGGPPTFTPQFTTAPTAAGGSAVRGTAAPILVGATLGSSDLVAAAAGVLAAPAYTLQSDAGLWAADQNITNTTAATALSGTVPSGGLSINALRNIATASGSVTIGGGDTLTLASGMLLHTPNNTLAISGGSLTSGNGQDLVAIANQSTVTISSAVTGAIAVTKAGAGTLVLSGTNSHSGTNVLAGTLQFNSAAALGQAAPIQLLGGILRQGSGGAVTVGSGYAVTVGALGATLANTNTSANSTTVAAAVQVNGALTIGDNNHAGTITLAGTLSGSGPLSLNGGASNAKAVTVLGGDNSGWGGNVRFAGGSGLAHLRVASPTGLGPGTVANSQQTPGFVYFTEALATAATFGNSFSLANPTVLTNWALGPGLGSGAGPAITLSGTLGGGSGLVLQGRAVDANAVSELVLAGSVSMTGQPTTYSYGTSSLAQNFVNARGGVALGVTAFQGLTAVANNALVDLPVGTVSNGAEGFVRFSGADSFIPGAVGPGYVAALRRGGAGGSGLFGYLLTGSVGGTSYQLPEGKTFVIGSLGSGVQVGGTLGATGGSTTLLGSAGLAGAPAGTINLHANAAGDSQALTVLVRGAGDVFTLGGAGSEVTFSPTWGDSGASSAYTLLQTRTGTSALTKAGAGTLVLANVGYRDLAGGDVSGSFSWQIGRGGSDNTPAAPYFEGAIRETGSTAATSLLGFNVNFAGGVLETNDVNVGGAFTRGLGSGPTQVRWGQGGGGLAAFGGALTVNVGGAGATQTWGAADFVPDNNPLILGSPTATHAVTLLNPLDLGAVVRELRVPDNAASTGDRAVLAGVLSGGGAGGLLKTGAGELELSATSTFGGTTTISAGTLRVGADAPSGAPGALGNATSDVLLGDANSAAQPLGLVTSGAVTIGRGVTVSASGTGPAILGGASAHASTFSGPVTLNRAAQVTAAAGGTATFSGLIDDGAGSFGLTKTGPGTVTLTRAGGNSYDGGTAVNAGLLLVNNSTGSGTGSGPVTVNSGATLGGSGRIAGPVTVSGGTLSPGNSPGVLTLDAGLSLSASSTFAAEINGAGVAGSDYDQVRVTAGNVSLDGTLSLSLGTWGYNVADRIWPVSNTGSGSLSGAFTGLPNQAVAFTRGGLDYRIFYGANEATNQLAGGNDVLLAPLSGPLVSLSGPAAPVLPGDMFDITVSVVGNQAFANGLVGLTFDPTVVSYVGATAGGVFGSFFGSPLVSGNAMFAAGDLHFVNDRSAEGLVATITFLAVSGGSAGFSTMAKNSDFDPDFGRSGFVLANGSYLATSVLSPISVFVVPEPGSAALLGLGAAWLCRRRRRACLDAPAPVA